ncbi:hypothetical protein PC129_g24716, partial [Phytophthora cactorum]
MESLTAAPSSPVVLPRVAPGQDSGFAPSIQPGPTVGPSPSKKLERSESPMGDTPDATPRVPSSPPSAAPPSPPASASPSLPARVPMRSSDEGLDVDMTAPPSVPDSPPDASALDDGSIPPPAVPDSPSEDESMEPPQAPAAASLPRVDPRPTMADVLSQQELLRRDHAETEAARRRVETPKPLACDIEAIERQYAAGGDWSFIASRMEQARPYALPRARYDMVIDTGRTFAKTPLQKIMASLSGKSHGSDVLERLY